jgi:gluconate:H+ symporter, GntP family
MDPLLILLIGVTVVVGGILALRLHAFLALVLGGLVVAGITSNDALEKYGADKKLPGSEITKLQQQTFAERLTREFGNSAGRIGILIALASIIGQCLMASGGAERIVRSAMRVLGEARAPLAFFASGYLLAIPIFYDTVFLLLIPLGKAVWLHTRRNYTFYICAMVAGGTMTHSLVPPTPGPLFVAAELKVDMGLMILMGCLVSLVAGAAGYAYGHWLNRRLEIPVRETTPGALEKLQAILKRDEKELPPLWLSLLPIALPVILIGGNAALGPLLAGAAKTDLHGWHAAALAIGKLCGDANLALAISCVIALLLLARQSGGKFRELGAQMTPALQDAGMIILITAAGGAFGGVLQQTGIGPRIAGMIGDSQVAILPVAWLVTVLIRAAQGSATVAMITSVGMFASFATAAQLGFNPVYLALAIASGSKPLPWMNDSGFWVIGKMSGMTERETLTTMTVMLSITGVVGLVFVMVLAKVWPMV